MSKSSSIASTSSSSPLPAGDDGDELVGEIAVDDLLVEPVCENQNVGLLFEDQCLPASKRPRKMKYSSDIHIDDIHLPDPFPDPFPSGTAVVSSPGTDSQNSESSEPSERTSGADSAETDESEIEEEENFSVGSINIEEAFNSGFYEYFDYGSDVLYDSSDLTVIQTLAILFTWFSSSPGISKEAFSRLLHVLHHFLLPKNNNLPDTYTKALTLVSHLLAPVIEYDCCANDCIVYRKYTDGDFTQSTSCPKCNSARYEDGTTVAKKKFKYLPIGPRLQRMFSDETVSHLLQSHLPDQDNTNKEPSTSISDLHQSEAWLSCYSETGPFQGDPRGISLSLCTDGMNPFSKEKVSYSMWPITLNILNFPYSVRSRPGSMMLVGIIPGRSEPCNLDPYIKILVDEIMGLQGFECYDMYQKEYFKMRVDIFMNVLDYPGQNKLFHCHGAGAYAGCGYCTHRGEYSQILQKMVYPGNRCFLKKDDSLRRDSTNFPSKGSALAEAPQLKTMEYVDSANEKYAAARTIKERVALTQTTGCKGAYALRILPSHDRLLSTPIDPMHLIKNIVSHCVNFIAGNEDSYKVREEERSRNRFTSSWATDSDDSLPPAPFSLSKVDIQLADERAKRVYVPQGFDWQPREVFGRTTGMKSHQWKQLSCSGILKFCLRGMLGKKQRSTLFKLFDVLQSVCAESIMADSIDDLEQEVHKVLVLFERDFPVSLQVIVFHLLHHLPIFIRRLGPVYNFWMYPFERFNSWITRRVLNRRYPEATVTETYRLSEWANFMEVSGKLAKGTLSYIQSYDDDSSPDNGCIRGSKFFLEEDFMEYLVTYYSSELSEYKELLEQYEKEKNQAHLLKHFPDMSQWVPKGSLTLSPMQRELCGGPSMNAVQLKHYKYEDSHGRLVTINTAECEPEHSYCRSSYVSTIKDLLRVGRVLFLFQHTFLSTTTTFACVSWFDGPYLDTESKLNYVFTSAQNQSVLPISSLSRPLVIAYDDEEIDKLWILNL